MAFGNRDLIAASPEYARAHTRYSNEVDPVIRALEPATEEEYGYPWRYRPGYWTAMRPIDKIREDIYREFAQSLAAKSLRHGYVMDGPPGDGFAPREVIVPLDAKLADMSLGGRSVAGAYIDAAWEERHSDLDTIDLDHDLGTRDLTGPFGKEEGA